MTTKNIKMLVSSSFLGRDKSIIKSILNIDNCYGHLVLEYIEQYCDDSIYLTKDANHYYAVLNGGQSTVSIGPELNPKTALKFFQNLSQSPELNRTDQHLVNKHSVIEHVYKYMNSEAEQMMEIKSTQNDDSFHIILDGKNKKVYGNNKDFTDTIQLKALNGSASNLTINFLSDESQVDLAHSMSLTDFKWSFGLMLNDDVLHFEFKSSEHMIKLLAWPDYGCFPYQKEYLQLSSILFKHKLTYVDLIKCTHFPEKTISGFLNANILLNYLTLVPNTKKGLCSMTLKDNGFIKSLKSFFSQSLHFRSKA